MDKFKQLLSWIRTLPIVGKIISAIILVLLFLLLTFFSTSCGTTHATVRIKNPKDNPVVNLSITTNNPTSVDVQPSVRLDSTNVKIK